MMIAGFNLAAWGCDAREYIPRLTLLSASGHVVPLSYDVGTLHLWPHDPRLNHVAGDGWCLHCEAFCDVRSYDPAMLGEAWRLGFPYQAHLAVTDVDLARYEADQFERIIQPLND